MLRGAPPDLDYLRLIKEAKQLSPCGGPSIRLGLLGEVSTQHLAPLLKVLFARNGVDAEIYEAGFDTVEMEARDENSGLSRFKPQVVAILKSTERLKEQYDGSLDDAAFARGQMERTVDVWRALVERLKVPILQTTYVLPPERPYGNYSAVTGGTLHDAVRELNRELGLAARANRSIFLLDVDRLAAWVGRRHFIDEKLWLLCKSLCSMEFLPHVAQELVDMCLAQLGRMVKCLVLDLDNTLWGGVVGDDGLDGIRLGHIEDGEVFQAFQRYLRQLSRRGILLAVCSKNDEALARRVFREHPDMLLKEEDIAVFVANWDDKATNIRRIQETLNIGFDSMVFIDDSPFERNLVRQLLPEVIVPEMPADSAHYVRALSELNLFEVASWSSTDASRTEQVRVESKRGSERQKFANVEEYLAFLETVATVGRFEPHRLPRIVQLIQRSNQFNLTTRRHSEGECVAFMEDEKGCFPFWVEVRDRFGDFGLINVVVARATANDVLEIDTFVMSCRVLKRGVEEFAMNKIFEHARQRGLRRVVGRHIPTAKNGMVADFYPRFGFQQTLRGEDGSTTWMLEVDAYRPVAICIREEQPQPANREQAP